MWKIIKTTGIILFLILCSIQDIREKRISLKLLIVFGSIFFIVSILFEEMRLEQRIHNLFPGLAALLISFLTKEQIGYGDAACLIILGSVISAVTLLNAIMGGLILLSICSVVLLAGKRANRKSTLPFIPFLSTGIALQIVLNNV